MLQFLHINNTLCFFPEYYQDDVSSSTPIKLIIDMHVCTVCLALCAHALEECHNVY